MWFMNFKIGPDSCDVGLHVDCHVHCYFKRHWFKLQHAAYVQLFYTTCIKLSRVSLLNIRTAYLHRVSRTHLFCCTALVVPRIDSVFGLPMYVSLVAIHH